MPQVQVTMVRGPLSYKVGETTFVRGRTVSISETDRTQPMIDALKRDKNFTVKYLKPAKPAKPEKGKRRLRGEPPPPPPDEDEEEVEDEETEEEDDEEAEEGHTRDSLSTLKKSELREVADEMGIEYETSDSKSALIDAILDAQGEDEG